VHLQPQGAGYSGTSEVFLKGKPLNLTDIEFGKDGAMYFITGGRGTQSGLYRVAYTAGAATDRDSMRNAKSAVSAKAPGGTGASYQECCKAARDLRRELEALHGHKDPRAVDFAWPHLSSEDRFIRFAARIAIEWQD